MTDNHSTDQNNNNNNKKNVTDNSDEKMESYENEIIESMNNGRDSASSASNGVKRRE
jgi:hypothetical protein